MTIQDLTIHQLYHAYANREVFPSEVLAVYIKNYQDRTKLNAFIEHFTDSALEQAHRLDKLFDVNTLLWAVPGAIKDNFSIINKHLTCASMMLGNYISPYSSSVVEQLIEQKFINLGRLNMDEFAMGSTGRYSAYGAALNPLDQNRVAGGSSSGSAVAVAAGQALFSIGSDTGGSSRLPASYTGICGFKPTYGTISRYGMVAFAPSFDVPGILAKTPLDIAMVYQGLLKEDLRDQIMKPNSFNWKNVNDTPNLKGVKVALFDSLLNRADNDVITAYNDAKQFLKDAGAEFVSVSLDLEDYLIKIYYILTCSEAASSLSRFDGARYGSSVPASDIENLIAKTRSQHLGHEVTRRILMGNYFLMSNNYDNWYKKALHIRSELVSKLNALFRDEDTSIWLWPGFHEASLVSASEYDSYTSDIVSVAANLYGGPAIAIPTKKGRHQLPVSIQIAGSIGSDETVLQVAHFIYRHMNWKNMNTI